MTGDFRFAVAADRTGGERPEVFRRGLERIREYGPDFIVSVGDLIDGYTTDRAHANRQWDEFLSLSGRFGMPFFYVPGTTTTATGNWPGSGRSVSAGATTVFGSGPPCF